MPQSPNTQNYDQQIQTILSEMRAKGYDQMATEFAAFAQAFHAQHPTITAQGTLNAFLATALGRSLNNAIGGTGALLGQVPGAAAKGAENAFNSLDVFKGLNLGSLIMRVGEVVLGIVLVGIGLNALLKNPVGKAASVTPVGRIAKAVK